MPYPFSRRTQAPSASQDGTDDAPTPLSSVARTLLPTPIASLVSLATATGSISLKIGGFIGHLAINTTRVGALTGVELSRAILESVLFQAGRDVVDSSTGEVGRAAAENVLASTLSMIQNSLTHTSFLISAGFRIGSSSLSAGIGLSHALCTAIDAILGDTETSKAIATIVVMMQHEFNNPATGIERLSLIDLLTGSIGFVLLQKWSHEKSEKRLKDDDVVEPVWDIVVVDSSDDIDDAALSAYGGPVDGRPISEGNELVSATRPTSFVFTGDETGTLDSMLIDDAASMCSVTSTQRPGSGADIDRPELAFKRQLTEQLAPGTSVKVTAQSILRNTVAVEMQGNQTPDDLEPPPGYILIAVENQHADSAGRRKFIFQNIRRRARRGSFEVAGLTPVSPPTPLAIDAEPFVFLQGEKAAQQIEVGESSTTFLEDAAGDQMQPQASPHLVDAPVTIRANGKRPRSPKTSRDITSSHAPAHARGLDFPGEMVLKDGDWPVEKNGKRTILKNSLKRGTPYSKLVDFWNYGSHGRNHRAPGPDRTPGSSRGNALWTSGSTRRKSNAEPDRPTLSRVDSRTSMELRPSIDLEQRPGSRESYKTRSVHRRGGSSIYNLQTNVSDSSLVLHADSRMATRERLAQSLNGSGRLAGQYPLASFAQNVSRFARFSVAAYGSAFLRFMGAAVDQQPWSVEEDADHHLEHRSFSQYAGLPPSTIILSSFVDPEGGASLSGTGEGALPLIHFISVDHELKVVVLTCRGTLGFEDVLTDMTCNYDELQWRGKTYAVHKGMLASARRLVTIHGGRLITTLKAALEEFDDYGLVLCGHSLGGGVAAILGILLAQPNPNGIGDCSAFLTSSPSSQLPRPDGAPYPHPADALALTLPPNRPVHVYAYGPAATMSASLSMATRGLITSIINNGDIVPYLCLGNLRDMQSIALAFKRDDSGAKAEVRRRVWDGLKKALTERTGIGLGETFFARDWARSSEFESKEDEWPWRALQDLRTRMSADKLVPPGECFIVERRTVLQRLAFTDAPGKDSVEFDGTKRAAKSFKPASHIRVTHVKDPAIRFSELRFQGSMFLDHIPARYERLLEALESGIA